MLINTELVNAEGATVGIEDGILEGDQVGELVQGTDTPRDVDDIEDRHGA